MLRSWPILLLCAIVAVGASFAFNGRENPTYTASTALTASSLAYGSVLAGGAATVNVTQQLETAASIASLPVVAQLVVDQVGPDVARGASIRATVAETSSILTIQATSPRAQAAADIANAAAKQFLKYRRQLNAKSLVQVRQVLRDQISAAPTKSAKRPIIGKRDSISALQALNDQAIVIAQAAGTPSAASAGSQSTARTAGIALVLGLVVGAGIALLRGPGRSTQAA